SRVPRLIIRPPWVPSGPPLPVPHVLCHAAFVYHNMFLGGWVEEAVRTGHSMPKDVLVGHVTFSPSYSLRQDPTSFSTRIPGRRKSTLQSGKGFLVFFRPQRPADDGALASFNCPDCRCGARGDSKNSETDK